MRGGNGRFLSDLEHSGRLRSKEAPCKQRRRRSNPNASAGRTLRYVPRVPPRRRRFRSSSHLEPLASLLSQPATGGRSLPIPPHAWWQAVGPRIAERARPIRLVREELTIRAATATWAQELSFLAPTIVGRLKKLGFPVQRLRFYVGPVEPPLRRPEPALPKLVPPPAKLSETLSGTIAKVENDALRDAILRAAAANLAWQKMRESSSPTAMMRAARALRFVAREIAPQGQSSPRPPEASPGKP